MHTRRHPYARGFTLIEIMVVIVILGVLAALIVPQIISRPDEARVVAATARPGATVATPTSARGIREPPSKFFPSARFHFARSAGDRGRVVHLRRGADTEPLSRPATGIASRGTAPRRCHAARGSCGTV